MRCSQARALVSAFSCLVRFKQIAKLTVSTWSRHDLIPKYWTSIIRLAPDHNAFFLCSYYTIIKFKVPNGKRYNLSSLSAGTVVYFCERLIETSKVCSSCDTEWGLYQNISNEIKCTRPRKAHCCEYCLLLQGRFGWNRGELDRNVFLSPGEGHFITVKDFDVVVIERIILVVIYDLHVSWNASPRP